MKAIQLVVNFSCIIMLIIGFSRCSSAQKTTKITKVLDVKNNNAPKVYYQHWVAGVRGGGSGVNLIISKTILKNTYPITVYFRKQTAVVEVKQDNYVTRFQTQTNQRDPKEMANQNEIDFPFILAKNEAVISYHQNNKIKYLKLSNIPEKEILAYPSAPPQN